MFLASELSATLGPLFFFFFLVFGGNALTLLANRSDVKRPKDYRVSFSIPTRTENQ